ncbi:unnamed protein product, partial [Prorocentrum cordatum]
RPRYFWVWRSAAQAGAVARQYTMAAAKSQRQQAQARMTQLALASDESTGRAAFAEWRRVAREQRRGRLQKRAATAASQAVHEVSERALLQAALDAWRLQTSEDQTHKLLLSSRERCRCVLERTMLQQVAAQEDALLPSVFFGWSRLRVEARAEQMRGQAARAMAVGQAMVLKNQRAELDWIRRDCLRGTALRCLVHFAPASLDSGSPREGAAFRQFAFGFVGVICSWGLESGPYAWSDPGDDGHMMTHMTTMTNSVKTEVTKRFDDQVGDITEQPTANQEMIRRVASLASGVQGGVVATRFEIAKPRGEKVSREDVTKMISQAMNQKGPAKTAERPGAQPLKWVDWDNNPMPMDSVDQLERTAIFKGFPKATKESNIVEFINDFFKTARSTDKFQDKGDGVLVRAETNCQSAESMGWPCTGKDLQLEVLRALRE